MTEQQKDLFDDNLIHVESMNKKSKGTFYTIDRTKLSCTCPAFVRGMTRPCKHMKAVLPDKALAKAASAGQSYNDSTKLENAKPKKESGAMGEGLYTVGHSNYTVEYFINKLLVPNGITTLVDVRSKPYSKFNSQFNRQTLAASLYKSGIRYFYGGDRLGGIGKGCPSIETVGFVEAMEKVMEIAKTEGVALMCAERHPNECHRAMKLTAYTVREFPELLPQHITKEGLIDATAMDADMPAGWFWHEFGGKYGKA